MGESSMTGPTWDEQQGSRQVRKTLSLEGRCLQGRYLIRELIGEGAYGRVYRAEQLALHRTVAVKVIGPLSDADADLARQFHDEVFAASRILHPNVVSTFDYGQTDDGLLYVVMEYLPGRTISRVLAEEGAVSPERAINLVMQMLGALEQAHAAGVVHADLKSENIIVQDLGGAGELVKVIDFSIARLLRGNVRGGSLWRSGSQGSLRIAGTPQYMAPEVISGRAPTEQADIYAVGVLLYQLITGAVPFSGDTSLEIMMQHLDAPVRRPSARFRHLVIPLALEQIILRALAKAPEDRYGSAASFRDALLAVRLASAAAGAPEAQGPSGGRAEHVGVTTSEYLSTRKIARLLVKGGAALEAGNFDEAIGELRRAVPLAARLGNPSAIVECYVDLGNALVCAGRVDEAISELEEASSLLGCGGAELGRVYMTLASLFESKGQDREALVVAYDALELAQRVGSAPLRAAAGDCILRLQQQRHEGLAASELV